MSFLEYFSKTICKIRIIHKEASLLMRLIAVILALSDKLKITNIGNFYTYVTTIGNRIYAPRNWSKDMYPSSTLLHELTHILESKHYTFYYLEYIFSKKKRAFYESVCQQTEFLQRPDRIGTLKSLKERATALKRYGCDYKYTLKELQTRVKEIQEGRPNKCAREVYDAYNSWICVEFTKKVQAESSPPAVPK